MRWLCGVMPPLGQPKSKASSTEQELSSASSRRPPATEPTTRRVERRSDLRTRCHHVVLPPRPQTAHGQGRLGDERRLLDLPGPDGPGVAVSARHIGGRVVTLPCVAAGQRVRTSTRRARRRCIRWPGSARGGARRRLGGPGKLYSPGPPRPPTAARRRGPPRPRSSAYGRRSSRSPRAARTPNRRAVSGLLRGRRRAGSVVRPLGRGALVDPAFGRRPTRRPAPRPGRSRWTGGRRVPVEAFAAAGPRRAAAAARDERQPRGGDAAADRPSWPGPCGDGVPLLVDAAQSLGRAPVPEGWSVLTGSAHKWGGPAGVGF